MIEGKVWGTTEPLITNPLCELHRIIVQPGGYCSVHKHAGRANVFYVVRGELIVRVWSPGGARVKGCRLVPGEHLTVPPRVMHQFRNTSNSPCEVLELYYPVLQGADIERVSEGGVSK